MKTNRGVSLLLLACKINGLHVQDGGDGQLIIPDAHTTQHQPAFGNSRSTETVVQTQHDHARLDYLDHAVQALDVMQAQFYELWIGTWPTAIDWTAAVINTHVSAILGTLARNNDDRGNFGSSEVFHRYFSHNIAYYFGENAFAIRNEAYDDMLWVVLGWIESIKFINDRNLTDPKWHGTQFISAFAHRARIFWDIASQGWDTSICDGGMIWNPRLTPYKNAITNQLFISASVNMYLYFPGDNNTFPFMAANESVKNSTPGRAYDGKYLKAAIDGYAWLKGSNMTNSQGLYVDGYHVTNWGKNGTTGTGKCDERNEVVYTYNQGVVLTGLRGLWEATGDQSYLNDGYQLVKNVMKATGWSGSSPTSSPTWAGLGQAGVLEEHCDRRGSCSQDAQSFKGIFFQHLADFCMALPLEEVVPGTTHGASKSVAALHSSNCLAIGAWVEHNAKAALRSRDEHGRFGMWWGRPSTGDHDDVVALPHGAKDYRNDATMLFRHPWHVNEAMGKAYRSWPPIETSQCGEVARDLPRRKKTLAWSEDVNDRGRGRTVETQAGGLAVLRAAWEMVGVSKNH